MQCNYFAAGKKELKLRYQRIFNHKMVSGNKREDLPLSNHTKGDSGVNLIDAAAEGHALAGKGAIHKRPIH